MLNSLETIFEQLSARLEGKDYLLGGTEPSKYDVAFASIAALLLLPKNYGGNFPESRYRPLELIERDLESSPVGVYPELVRRLRDTVAGAHGMKMYERYRSAKL